MKNFLFALAAIVVTVSTAWIAYMVHQESLRKKELDKKMSDNLDLQKNLSGLIKDKIEKGELSFMTTDGTKFSSNGHKKKKVIKLKKQDA